MAHVPGSKAKIAACHPQARDPVEGELAGDAEGRAQARRRGVAGTGEGKRRCHFRDTADRAERLWKRFPGCGHGAEPRQPVRRR